MFRCDMSHVDAMLCRIADRKSPWALPAPHTHPSVHSIHPLLFCFPGQHFPLRIFGAFSSLSLCLPFPLSFSLFSLFSYSLTPFTLHFGSIPFRLHTLLLLLSSFSCAPHPLFVSSLPCLHGITASPIVIEYVVPSHVIHFSSYLFFISLFQPFQLAVLAQFPPANLFLLSFPFRVLSAVLLFLPPCFFCCLSSFKVFFFFFAPGLIIRGHSCLVSSQVPTFLFYSLVSSPRTFSIPLLSPSLFTSRPHAHFKQTTHHLLHTKYNNNNTQVNHKPTRQHAIILSL